MSNKIEFTKEALLHNSKIIKSANKAYINKLDLLFEELKKHPTSGSGNPEKPKHHLSGYGIRRRKKKNVSFTKLSNNL